MQINIYIHTIIAPKLFKYQADIINLIHEITNNECFLKNYQCLAADNHFTVPEPYVLKKEKVALSMSHTSSPFPYHTKQPSQKNNFKMRILLRPSLNSDG